MVTNEQVDAALEAYFGVREQQGECPDDHPQRLNEQYWDFMAMRAALEAAYALGQDVTVKEGE